MSLFQVIRTFGRDILLSVCLGGPATCGAPQQGESALPVCRESYTRRRRTLSPSCWPAGLTNGSTLRFYRVLGSPSDAAGHSRAKAPGSRHSRAGVFFLTLLAFIAAVRWEAEMMTVRS